MLKNKFHIPEISSQSNSRDSFRSRETYSCPLWQSISWVLVVCSSICRSTQEIFVLVWKMPERIHDERSIWSSWSKTRGSRISMWLLPPANEVWGKVIFLHRSVILFTGGFPGTVPPRDQVHLRDQVHPPDTHPTAVRILLECILVAVNVSGLQLLPRRHVENESLGELFLLFAE